MEYESADGLAYLVFAGTIQDLQVFRSCAYRGFLPISIWSYLSLYRCRLVQNHIASVE